MGMAIKYRAWDNVNSVMRKVTNISFRTGIIDVEPRDNTLEGYELYDPVLFEGQYELMQYTGLIDDNDVEIFERDIVEFIWSGQDGETHKETTVIKDIIYYMTEEVILINYAEELKVIGNIYENPELL